MIRAGRRHLVRTLADLAAQQGMQLSSYLNAKPYRVAGFPTPISSVGARNRLYDNEQVDAFLAGRPIPTLPTEDDSEDLLDRRECSAALGISLRTWDKYKATYPILTNLLVIVGGVEHWPRIILTQQQTQPTAPGRPERTGGRAASAAVPSRTQ